ncbi:MAG: PilN domain-containing protein [Acidobacteria bacterium]|nr:PilN domain-containing protein [Acidobacteriota bacterium]
MIRINLLRQNVITGSASLAPERANLMVWGVAMLCLTLLAMGGWWWVLTSQIGSAEREAEDLGRQIRRLAEAQKQMAQYENQGRLLQERISVIERLRKNQTGPSGLLKSILSSVPDRPTLWLTGLSQKGNSLTLEGRSFDVPSIADFIANLSRDSSFQAVELAYWQEEEPAIKFQLNCSVR